MRWWVPWVGKIGDWRSGVFLDNYHNFVGIGFHLSFGFFEALLESIFVFEGHLLIHVKNEWNSLLQNKLKSNKPIDIMRTPSLHYLFSLYVVILLFLGFLNFDLLHFYLSLFLHCLELFLSFTVIHRCLAIFLGFWEGRATIYLVEMSPQNLEYFGCIIGCECWHYFLSFQAKGKKFILGPSLWIEVKPIVEEMTGGSPEVTYV